jgi:hypothetical protein
MDRDELHERVMLLKEEMEAGRLFIREGLTIGESLRKVRFAADGKVDPSTVDSAVRSLAMAAAFGRSRREVKKIPLKETQEQYFEILERFFGQPFAEMKKHDLTPPEVAADMASRPKVVEAFAADAGEFVAGIKEFWQHYGPVVEAHLEDMRALKSVFGGDIFPSYQGNIATSVGLYVDTLILPDPLLRMANLVGAMKPDQLFFLTAKHALNALQYKELALALVDPPIVVIAPDPSYTEGSYRSVLQFAGETDLLSHSSRLFGRSFADLDELTGFLEKISDPQELVAMVSDRSRLLFDIEWSGPLEEQIRRYTVEVDERFEVEFSKQPVGKIVQFTLLGRMMQANDVIFKASQLHGNPLIDAPTSWQYLLWKYEYDNKRPVPNARDVLIANAISVEGSLDIGLLSGLPSEALIELRRAGAMSELRTLIGKGIRDIDSASQSSLAEVGSAVTANISEAFARHQKELRSLSSERKKFFGLDVGRWVAFGGVAIGAASSGSTGLGVLTACLGMIGSPSVDELRKRWREVRSHAEHLRRSPAGILFRHVKHGE